MAEKVDEQNRQAGNVNPLRSGMRTGNPQLRPQKPRKSEKKPARRSPQATGKPDRQP